jgi:undecaprenyl-diphosphatase
LISGLRSLLRSQQLVLFVCLLSLIGFLFLVFLKNSFAAADMTVNSWAVSIRMSSLTLMAEIIAHCFDRIVLFFLSLLVAAYFLFKGYRKYALLFVGSMGVIAALITIVKELVHSPRPLNGIMEKIDFSFPSGHVTSTIVFFGLLIYFLWTHQKSSNVKIMAGLFFVTIEVLIGFSRVYLNVHWLSDITGGYLLGSFWLTFSILLLSIPRRLINEPRTYESLGN